MKKYAFGIVALVMAIGFSAFTTKNHKPLPSKVFYMKAGAPHQRLEAGFTTGNVKSQSIISTSPGTGYRDVANWTDVPQGQTAYAGLDGTSFVMSLEISSYETTSDGDNNGAISLQEALDQIFADYTAASSVYPTSAVVNLDGNGTSVSVVNITKGESVNP